MLSQSSQKDIKQTETKYFEIVEAGNVLSTNHHEPNAATKTTAP